MKVFLALYSLVLLELAWFYLTHYIVLFEVICRRSSTEDYTFVQEKPFVTIQIPIYNELQIPALESALNLNWPVDKLHIQLLDDSDVNIQAIHEKNILYAGLEGRVSHRCRLNRDGFKAGALQAALPYTADYIAIFDADFSFNRFWLEDTMHLMSGNVACVQTRWTFRNRTDSIVSRVAAVLLDGHFGLEKIARNQKKQFVGFNGSGGLWRKAAIESAGGWASDTLSEDTDLSYRVQRKGWRIIYDECISCESELPTKLDVFMTQQTRWAKGSIEVAKKQLFLMLKDKEIGLFKKISAIFNLSTWFNYLLMLLALLVCLPLRMSGHTYLSAASLLLGTPFLLVFPYYMIANEDAFLLPIIGTIMLPSMCWAALEALFGIKTGFVRTPKKGDYVTQA